MKLGDHRKKQAAQASKSVITGKVNAVQTFKSPLLKSLLDRKYIYGPAVLAVILGAVLFLWHPWRQSAEINPAMTTRVLDIPESEIGYPGLSGDGNWAAFPGKDAGGNWRVYFMNTGGGEPKAITSDSIAGLSSVDVSFDGSRVAYDATMPGANQQRNIYLTSSLGGERN